MSDTDAIKGDEVVTTIKPALLVQGHEAATGLTSAEGAAAKAVRSAGIKGLAETLKAYVTFAAWLVSIVKEMGDEAIDEVGGNAILTFLKAHVAPADWGSLPTGVGTYVKAVQVHKWHTGDTWKAFGKTENAPDMDVYCPWLQVNATGKFGNKSGYDIKASLINPADWDDTANSGKGGIKPGAKFGTLVKKSVARGTGGGGSGKGVKTPDALAKVLKMDRAKLAQVPTVAKFNLTDEQVEGVVLQLVAKYLLMQSEQVETSDETPAIELIAAE